jgi:hypothetical protein
VAATSIPAPGTELGPCEGSCAHRDCEESRRMAAAVRRFCERPIGYGTRLYNEGAFGSYDLVHALCLEESVERSEDA